MKQTLTYIILIIFNVYVHSQVSEDRINFLLLSLDYSSNTSTFGLTVPETKQPNLISSATFASSINFDVSYIGIATANADSSLSKTAYEHDLVLGYNINLSDDFIICPAYSHLFHSKNSYALKSAFTDILQIDFMLYKKRFNSSLSVNYMLGDKNMVYTSLQNAFELNLDNVIIKNSNLNIQLGFILNLSDKNYYNKSVYDTWDGGTFVNWAYSEYPSLSRELAVIQSISMNGLENTKSNFYNTLNETNPEVFGATYDITSIDVYLPIFYSIKSFMFNFTLALNTPLISSPFYDSKSTLTYSTGISYSFAF